MKGRLVTPGLIDCHTHVVYGGNRAAEWELKLKGATYEEVAKAGGGIINSVAGTRKASANELADEAKPRVQAMMSEGVTSMEIKSGYGLEEEGERKQVRGERSGAVRSGASGAKRSGAVRSEAERSGAKRSETSKAKRNEPTDTSQPTRANRNEPTETSTNRTRAAPRTGRACERA
jgi:imidazolonepropionase